MVVSWVLRDRSDLKLTFWRGPLATSYRRRVDGNDPIILVVRANTLLGSTRPRHNGYDFAAPYRPSDGSGVSELEETSRQPTGHANKS